MKREIKQRGLPFPAPSNADLWPNRLGFDLGGIEFWCGLGCRDLGAMKYGIGTNWVAALNDMLVNQREVS